MKNSKENNKVLVKSKKNVKLAQSCALKALIASAATGLVFVGCSIPFFKIGDEVMFNFANNDFEYRVAVIDEVYKLIDQYLDGNIATIEELQKKVDEIQTYEFVEGTFMGSGAPNALKEVYSQYKLVGNIALGMASVCAVSTVLSAGYILKKESERDKAYKKSSEVPKYTCNEDISLAYSI